MLDSYIKRLIYETVRELFTSNRLRESVLVYGGPTGTEAVAMRRLPAAETINEAHDAIVKIIDERLAQLNQKVIPTSVSPTDAVIEPFKATDVESQLHNTGYYTWDLSNSNVALTVSVKSDQGIFRQRVTFAGGFSVLLANTPDSLLYQPKGV